MKVAITGGTGSLGRALIARLLKDGHERVVSVSRDEVKGGDLREAHPGSDALRVFLGNVTDKERLCQAFDGCDTVIHAAALKRVTESVYSYTEMLKTNIDGTANAILAAKEVGIKRFLFVSSDKAVHATNLYGATKHCGEAYAVQSNSYTYPAGLRVSCTRYGNVLGSRGSVLEVWSRLDRGASLPITNFKMTRFMITLPQAVDFILQSLNRMQGGEIFIPRLKSALIIDLARAVYPERQFRETGLRPGGEKLHEVLVSDEEYGRLGYGKDTSLVVMPSFRSWSSEPYNVLLGYEDRPYDSFNAPRLTVEELRGLCQELA